MLAESAISSAASRTCQTASGYGQQKPGGQADQAAAQRFGRPGRQPPLRQQPKMARESRRRFGLPSDHPAAPARRTPASPENRRPPGWYEAPARATRTDRKTRRPARKPARRRRECAARESSGGADRSGSMIQHVPPKPNRRARTRARYSGRVTCSLPAARMSGRRC